MNASERRPTGADNIGLRRGRQTTDLMRHPPRREEVVALGEGRGGALLGKVFHQPALVQTTFGQILFLDHVPSGETLWD